MFRWADASSSFVVLIATQLQDEGVVDIDVDVSRYTNYRCPAYYLVCADGGPPDECDEDERYEWLIPAGYAYNTLRRLLVHRSGCQSYDNGAVDPVPPAAERNDPAVNTGMKWALDTWWREPLVAIPGVSFSYSSFGYNVAAVALEEAMNTTFSALVKERIIDKLLMTSLQPDYEWVDIPGRAVGYNASGAPTGSDDVSYMLGGGGWIGTALDFGRYCRGLMGTELLTETQKTQVLWHPSQDNYGLGFQLTLDPNTSKVIEAAHDGDLEKAKTALKYYIQDGLCVAVMTNSEQADIWRLEEAVAGAAKAAAH